MQIGGKMKIKIDCASIDGDRLSGFPKHLRINGLEIVREHLYGYPTDKIHIEFTGVEIEPFDTERKEKDVIRWDEW